MKIKELDSSIFTPFAITRIDNNGRNVVEDYLLREESYTLFCNDKKITIFNCMPRELKELAVGHLYTRGIISSKGQVKNIQIDDGAKAINVNIDTTISVVEKNNDDSFSISAATVHMLQAKFEEHCILFRKTGASHSCALANETNILYYMEDIARHNSLDKLIGYMLLNEISPTGKIMIFSGRMAADMLEKASASGVKILIAPGAPSLGSVQIADNNNITLMGFVRKNNINIYTHPERIL